MFGKLIKRDWRGVWSPLAVVLLIMFTGAIVAGAATCITAQQDMTAPYGDLITAVSILGVMAGIFSIIFAGAATFFVPLYQFYKSRFTDQGYLTFTLPVSIHQNLLSSVLVTILCAVIGIVATVAAFFLVGLIYMASLPGFWQELPRLWSAFWDVFPQLFQVDSMVVETLLSLLLTVILAGLCQLLTVMLAITIGAVIAKKHKILTAIAVYYGISIAMSIVQAVVIGFPTLMVVSQGMDSTFLLLLPENLMFLLVSVGSYFGMHYLLKHKLNLN